MVWQKHLKGFKNPPFYFGCLAILLMFYAFSLTGSYSSFSGIKSKKALNAFFESASAKTRDNLFFSQGDKIALETPDLKIIQDSAISGIAVPSVVSVRVLGDTFGTSEKSKKEVVNYVVQEGDTVQSVASAHSISVNTLVWANDLTTSSKLKVGQNLVILPADGVLHIVRSGDTLGGVASKYKSKTDDIVAFNNLANQNDIYIGDILIVPGGAMPKESAPIKSNSNQVPLANNYFIFPTQGKITQGLHYYNAVDVANKCGTPVYAAAGGIVQRASGNGGWNYGMGNHITILHDNGAVTYYGHLLSLLVVPGQKVETGQQVALMGGQPGTSGAGQSTGCHLHFQVVGASNPLSRYALGANISYK